MKQQTKFYRKASNGLVVIFNGDGTLCTRLPGTWPLNSNLSGDYEHPEGIILTTEEAELKGIEAE